MKLNSLENAKDLVLPKTLNGDLYLNNLTSVEGLVLPETLNGDLYLSRLTSLVGITLPKTVGCIFVYGFYRKLEEVIEMQRQEKEQLKNTSKKLERIKQDGFISNTIIILNIILFGILSFIITMLVIK